MRKINIIILLVLCLTLLLLTGYIVDTEEPGTENQQKWSGLTGFTTSYIYVEDFADTWLANGFTEIRDLGDYQNTVWFEGSKAAVLAANAKGLKFIWGVTSSGTTITSTNWADFRAAILAAAQWAQDNGVYEFQIGNEEEWHIDEDTMTVARIITNLKSVATDVKAIFTRGKVSYSCMHTYIDDWIATGKGDIDILASNIYMGGTAFNKDCKDWETEITNLVNAFGVDGTYITEFNLNTEGLDHYSTDEAVQAEGINEMIEYIKASGMTRALYYEWIGDDFGALKDDGTYRLLWNQALLIQGL